MDNIVEIYCAVDDFMKIFWRQWRRMQITSGEKKQIRESKLGLSEVMTIIILFHMSNY